MDVREDVASGTEVARVRAVDPDRGQYGQVTYSIPSDVWREMFAINASTGGCGASGCAAGAAGVQWGVWEGLEIGCGVLGDTGRLLYGLNWWC